MTTWIKFDTDTGITVPASVRLQVFSATARDMPAVLAGDVLEWANAMPAAAREVDAITIAPYGATTITSFSGEVSDDELRTLRECLQFGRPGETATLFEEFDVSGTTQLFVCNGDGTATVHDAQLVFPTYARDTALPAQSTAMAMSLAIDVWKESLESEMDRLDALEQPLSVKEAAVPAAKRTRALPPPIRSSLSQTEVEAGLAEPERQPRLSRAEPHDGDSPGITTPPAPNSRSTP